MTVNTIINEFGKHLVGLAATNAICVSLGTRLVSAKNLYYGVEPTTATPMLTLIPYGGTSPRSIDKFESNLQIRIKAKTTLSALRVGQAVINHFHMRHDVMASGNGIVLANQSQPVFLTPQDGGEWKLSVVNLSIRHVKL